MKIIKKRIGYYPEVLDLDKEEIASIFNSGMDNNKIVNNVYLISKYQSEKNEKTFNTSVIYPHTSIVHYYNDIYIIKKGIFGFRDLSQVEIDDILKLMKYPDNLNDPNSKQPAPKVEEKKEQEVLEKPIEEKATEAETQETEQAEESVVENTEDNEIKQ